MSVNDRYVPVLPGTGGGTTRGLVEGHGRSLVTQIGQETPRVPHHHASHGPPPPRGRIVRSPPQSRRSIRRPRLVDLVDPFGEEARFAGRPAGGGGGGFDDRLEQDLAFVGVVMRQRRGGAEGAGTQGPHMRAEEASVEK